MVTFDKVKAFEYLSHEFISWFKEIKPDEKVEDNFCTLKLIKLHFFVCAASSDSKNLGLLHGFDNFYALPYGHVESNVYEQINNTVTLKLKRNNIILNEIPQGYFNDLPVDILKEAINSLKEKNKDIVLYSPMKLVELSHSWCSWINLYKLARQFNKFSMKIPVQMIQNENKIFNLN